MKINQICKCTKVRPSVWPKEKSKYIQEGHLNH